MTIMDSAWMDQIQDQKLKDDIQSLIKDYPQSTDILRRLNEYHLSLQQALLNDGYVEQSMSKKRKYIPGEEQSQDNMADLSDYIRIKDLSCTLPVRKKVDLLISSSDVRVVQCGTNTQIAALLEQIQIFCLHNPSKSDQSCVLVFISCNEDNQQVTVPDDSIICVVVHERPDIVVQNAKSLLGSSNVEIVCNLLQHDLKYNLIKSDLSEFKSKVCKNVYSSFMQCHLGAKEGHLFMLTTGLLFGFKKPVLYMPFNQIKSVEISGITSRTFDLVLSTIEKVFTFGMIAYEEFDGIMAYIHRHDLDKSLDSRNASASQQSALRIGGLSMDQVGGQDFGGGSMLPVDDDYNSEEDEDYVGGDDSEDGSSDSEDDGSESESDDDDGGSDSSEVSESGDEDDE
ncbi:hypothetical protein MP228_000732 [Amoeboaphelidium protococcarum]|nr:hypothetical protein MP228_000732 [Amoeboaphelidium protococcarum]